MTIEPEKAAKVTQKFIAEISENELAVRIVEAMWGLERPTPDPSVALAQMEEDSRGGALRAARAAMNYWGECIATSRQPS